MNSRGVHLILRVQVVSLVAVFSNVTQRSSALRDDI